MNMSLNDRKNRSLLRHSAAVLCTAGLFALTYHLVFVFLRGEADFGSHLVWAIGMAPEEMLPSFINGRERLWHVLVKLTFWAVGNVWKAAALVTAAAEAAAYLLLYLALDRMLSADKPRRWVLALLLGCAFLVSALPLHGRKLYSGLAAVNVWHNPTNYILRPFAAAVFYMTVDIYDRRRYGRPSLQGGAGDFAFTGGFWAQFRQPVYTRAELVLYPLCLLLSVDAKPSFLLVFAPAILVLLLADVIRTRGMLLPFCLKLAAGFLPAGLVVLRMFSRYFGDGFVLTAAAPAAAAGGDMLSGIGRLIRVRGHGITVYFIRSSFSSFGALLSTLGARLHSALRAFAFPLCVLLAAPRRGWRNTGTRLGWLCVIAGLLEALLLHETGSRAGHGNFYWGFFLAAWLLWSDAVARYAVLWREKSLSGAIVRWCGTALLAWHLAGGIAYLTVILRTLSPYH